MDEFIRRIPQRWCGLPAIEYANGDKEWRVNGEQAKKLSRSSPCAGKVVEIDGKKYKPIEV